jgi:hypothetical protein
MAPEVSRKPFPTITADLRRDLEDEIRFRAYAFYEERGRKDGYDLDDWLRAETELIKTAATAAGPFLSDKSFVFQAVYPETR